MDHILNSCPAIAQAKLNILNNINAIQYLRNPSIENIKTIITYLKEIKLYHSI